MSEPAILRMSADEYHADPAETPSLSASIARVLCTRSPLHAWAAHPKLNPNYAPTEDEKFDVGKVAHSLFLEGEEIAYVVHAADWKKKDAREAREYARSIGRVPLLAHQLEDTKAMVGAIQKQLSDHAAEPPLFTDGLPEQTLVWTEDVVCRARLDWLRDDRATIDDLKTTTRTANPDRFSRIAVDNGYDVQAAFYLRGLKAVTGATAEFRWAVAESSPPFALSVIAPGPDMLALAEAKVEWAIKRWAACLRSGEWAGYPTEVCYAELPPWEEARWLEKEEREAA